MDQPSNDGGFAYCRSEFSDPEGTMAELFDLDLISGSITEHGDLVMLEDYTMKTPRGQLPMGDSQKQATFATPRDVPMICTQQPTYVPYADNELGFGQNLEHTTSPISVDDQAHLSYANTGLGFTQDQSFPTSPIDPINNIFLTPPQDQYQPFEFDTGYMQGRTPSLDSGTTHGSGNGMNNSTTQFPSEQDFSWLDGLSSNNLQDLSSTLSPNRGRSASVGCKRSSVDLDKTEGLPKRARSVKGGYHCTYIGCDKIFNRACDERKHYKNVHAEKEHGCRLCESRFGYPKDVRRHMRQIHGIKSHSHLTSMSSVVTLLSKLKLWHKEQAGDEEPKEEPKKYILVTRDYKDFRKIWLEGIESSEALMREIGNVFDVRHVDDALLRLCRDEGRLGQLIIRKQLMSVVGKAVKAGKTLELHLTHRSDGKWRVPNCGD